MSSSFSLCYRRNPLFVSRQIVDEVILVPIRLRADDVESIFTLNEVGAFIWNHLDGEHSVQAIRDAIVAEFEVTQEIAEADLVGYLQQLEQIGALQAG